MITIRNTMITAAALLAVQSAFADWQVVEDFDDDVGAESEILTWNYRAESEFWGENYVVIEPDVGGENNGLFYSDPEHSGEQFAIIYSKWNLPDSGVVQGSTATLYFRWYQDGPDHNVNVGLSDVAPTTEGEDLRPNAGPMAYGDFETQILFDNVVTKNVMGADLGVYAVRDGGAFVQTEVARPDKTWINVWIVVYNRVQDGTSVYDESELYVQPDGGDQIKVQIPDGGGGFYDTFLFRNQTDDPLVAFYVGNFNDTGAGGTPNPNEQWYLDNVQIDYSGENLTIPPPPGDTWAGYPVYDEVWADTGDFLGWLNIQYDPWIWSPLLHGWMYLPESYVTSGGAWTYLPK